ncbi:hypothetical protein PENTCL1PPCAC_3127, partial [Pristionchus entomophagus]
MFIDILNVLGAFILMKYNRRKIRELWVANFPFFVKFRYRQTLQSIEQLLPVAFFHLFCFTAQYVGYEIAFSLSLTEVSLATLNGFIYTAPYYCFICPSILLWLTIIDEKRKKNELKNISCPCSEATASLLCSVATIIVVIYTVHYHMRKSWFEGVFKVILTKMQFRDANRVFTVHLQRFCVLRVIITLAFPSFVCLHAAVTIQRVVTTFSG